MGVNPTHNVCEEVCDERAQQDAKWGQQNHPDGTGTGSGSAPLAEWARDQARTRCNAKFAAGRGTWELILAEEFWEAIAETDPTKLRAELIQIAAVAVAWVEAIDRRPPQNQ